MRLNIKFDPERVGKAKIRPLIYLHIGADTGLCSGGTNPSAKRPEKSPPELLRLGTGGGETGVADSRTTLIFCYTKPKIGYF